MDAPRALVFRSLVKGNEDSGNEIAASPTVFRTYEKRYKRFRSKTFSKDISKFVIDTINSIVIGPRVVQFRE